MIQQLIRQLDDAILAGMQSAKRTGLSWREILRICKAALPLLDCYGKEPLMGNSSSMKFFQTSKILRITAMSK